MFASLSGSMQQFWSQLLSLMNMANVFLTESIAVLLKNADMPVAFWAVVSFIIGCTIGSFLNVCIWRIPRGESLSNPPSHCPKCGHLIRFYENIPLFSYLYLRGKCSSCKLKISLRYFLVELLVGILYCVIYLRVVYAGGGIAFLLFYFFLTSILVTIAFIDCDVRIIPDRLNYLLIASGVIFAFLFPKNWGRESHFEALLLSAFSGIIAALFVYGIARFIKIFRKTDALGLGDVKYFAAVGACLGIEAFLFIILISCLLVLIVIPVVKAVRHLVKHRHRFHKAFAYGPFLSAAIYCWMLFGPEFYASFMSWYAQLLITIRDACLNIA